MLNQMIDPELKDKKILVVEDDDFFRSAMTDYLKRKGMAVTEAPNGKIARDICGLSQFDIIVSDVQMPFMDGVELLKWVKTNRPAPFILMTGFTNLLETQSAFELGADDFVTKPFRNADLVNAISLILNPVREQKPQAATSDEYCKVSIEEFVARPKIDFDVHVRLSPLKMIKIGHAGDVLPKDRIQTYREKGLKFLYIRKEDFAKLVAFNSEVSKLVVNQSTISKEKKLNFMKYTADVILEKAFVAGVDKEIFQDANEMLFTTVGLISEDDEQFTLLELMNAHSDWVYAHSVATAMFAMMIARKMGHTSSQVFFKLGMAGMFHEIGYKELPREVIDKPRALQSQVERKLIESHTTRGHEILTSIKNVPSDVLDIVSQHHEDLQGMGYPAQLPKAKIHPLAKIFMVADAFTDIAVKGPQYNGLTGAAAAHHVVSFMGPRLDQDALKALVDIFPTAQKKVA